MLTLFGPAIAVTLVFFAVLFGVPESELSPGRKLDLGGVVLLSIGLLLITSGLAYLRQPGSIPAVVAALILAGVLVFIPFGRQELQASRPVHRPARAAPADHVAGDRHGRALRHQRARRADPALDLREHAARARLRPGTRVRRDLVPDRRVPGVDDHRRRAVPDPVAPRDAAHRADRRGVLRGHRLSAVHPVPSRGVAGRHEHGDRGHRLRRARRGPAGRGRRRGARRARPASRPASRTRRRRSAARSPRRSSASCSRPAPSPGSERSPATPATSRPGSSAASRRWSARSCCSSCRSWRSPTSRPSCRMAEPDAPEKEPAPASLRRSA